MAYYQQSTLVINGRFIAKEEEALISVFDRSFLYGDSVYEVVKTVQGTFFALERHMERLQNSLKLMLMNLPFTLPELANQLNDVRMRHFQKFPLEQHGDIMIRLVISRGEGRIGLKPSLATQPNIVMIAIPIVKNTLLDPKTGLKIWIADVRRNSLESTSPQIKSGNYLNNVLALGEAENEHYDDVVMVNAGGFITEGSNFNVHFVRRGKVLSPALEDGLLPGITRSLLLEMSEHVKRPIVPAQISLARACEAEEMFITSTTRGVMPVGQFGPIKYGYGAGIGPVTAEIKKSFDQYVEEYRLKSLKLISERFGIK